MRFPRKLLAAPLAVVVASLTAWAVVAGDADAAPGDPPPAADQLRVAYAGTQHRSIGVAGLAETVTRPLFGTAQQHFDDEASARGDTVAWVSRRETYRAQVFVRVGDGPIRRIPTPVDDVASHPAISADGSRVAFALTREGVGSQRDIWVAAVDGSGSPTRVTDGTGDNYWPTWSPDGTEIDFEGRRSEDNLPKVWCVTVGGDTPPELVTDGGGAGAGEPSWNTGEGRGDLIAYTLAPQTAGAQRIHIATRDGQNDRPMLNEPWQGRQPSWNATGTTVAFLSRSVGTGETAPDGIERVYTAVPPDNGCTCAAILHSAEDRLPSNPGWYTPDGGTEELLITRTTAPDQYTVRLSDIRPGAVDPRDLGVTLGREDPAAETNPDLLWATSNGDPWWSRPSYSPDAQQILVSVFEGVGAARVARLWVVNADGTNPQPLTVAGRTATSSETEAVWSPDGTRIAYSRREPGQPAQIRVIEAATGAQVAELPAVAEGYGDTEPAWSPDSTEIAFTRGQPHTQTPSSHVWVIAADGTGDARNISEASGCQCRSDYSPAFSPDGQQLAFGRSPDGMVVTDVRGDNCRVLEPEDRACGDDLSTPPTVAPHRPAQIDWSPDGSQLAYVSRRFGDLTSPEYLKTYDLETDFPNGLTWEIPGRHMWPAWQRANDVATAVVRDPGPVQVGETATVELSVTDKGPTPAYGIHVDLTVPDGVELTGLTGADEGTTCDVVRQSCELGTIGIGNQRVIRAELTASTPVTAPLSWTAAGWLADAVPGDNTAEVQLVFEAAPTSPPPSSPPASSPPPSSPPPSSAPPSSAPPTTAPPTTAPPATTPPVPPPATAPDIRGSVVVNPTPTWIGHRTTVTYTIRNVGDGTATNVSIRPQLPAGIPVVSRPGVCTTTTCELGTFAPGTVRTLVFVLVPGKKVTTTVRGTITATALVPRTVQAPLRVLQPKIEAVPAVGPPGFVTIIRGTDFPPGVRVRLKWDKGVTLAANPAVPNARGRFDAQLQVLFRDELGPRKVIGTGTGFRQVTTDFLVILPAQQPPGSVLRK
ncbi:hypothetical protein [Actinoplanes sp. RD1]|uniref:hypothetical protein n=1 Tax=Actinoplanes sp. RD1 TaxID=3064538 RepID=UPI002740B580|nr:hypothetical protein [Actinoplanes sp. RD1]